MSVEELYYAINLKGPIRLSYCRTDIFGYDITDEKEYPSGSELQYDLSHIGRYKVAHVEAIKGVLVITIEDP